MTTYFSRFALAIIVSASCAGSARATEVIRTIAAGGSLDGYPPAQANFALGNGAGVATDAIGDIFISDSAHNQVLKLSPTTGVLTLVAGNGSNSFSGDGGPATAAALNNPESLAVDSRGNLFIVDHGNNVIRRVDALTGIITTVAGKVLGALTYATGDKPDGVTALVVESGVPATSTSLSNGIGSIVAINDPALGLLIMVADTNNQIVRWFPVGVTGVSGNIVTFAGTAGNSGFGGDNAAATSATLDTPTGLAVDHNNDLYIADSGNRRVRKVDAGNITTVAGSGNGNFSGDGGAATSATLGGLGGLAFSKDGKLLITCLDHNRIREVDVASAAPIIITIAGNGNTTPGDGGPATAGGLSSPSDIAVDSAGNIYVYDTGHKTIRRIDVDSGYITTVAGTGLRGFIGDRGPKQFAVLSGPYGMAFDTAGNLYIADTGNNAVRKVDTSGVITTYAGNSSGAGLGDGGPAFLASVDGPRDVTVFGNTLYIADYNDDLIRAVDLTTGIITSYASVNNPVALLADNLGILYVAHDNVVETIPTTAPHTPAPYVGQNKSNVNLGDGLPAANANLSKPTGLALGPGGELYIADSGHNRIRVITPVLATMSTITSTLAGGGTGGDGGPATSAQLNNPSGVAVDIVHNRVVFCDTDDETIRAVDLTTNIITTIAGTGLSGFSGDDDLAASAQVNSPARMILHDGQLVFADRQNNRIRAIDTALDIGTSPTAPLDLSLLSLGLKLSFAVDKKSGQILGGKDSVALKAKLTLPPGINPANLKVMVDIVDLHQEFQLDAHGKLPKPVKAAKAAPTDPFDFHPPVSPHVVTSTVAVGLKGISTDKQQVAFSFSSRGTFRADFGRAGCTDVTTHAQAGVPLLMRVNIALGDQSFTGVTKVVYKAVQGKGGAGKSGK